MFSHTADATRRTIGAFGWGTAAASKRSPPRGWLLWGFRVYGPGGEVVSVLRLEVPEELLRRRRVQLLGQGRVRDEGVLHRRRRDLGRERRLGHTVRPEALDARVGGEHVAP